MGNTRHKIEGMGLTNFGHARLLYISTSKYEGDWQSIVHSHSFSELFYVVNGNGLFIAEDSEFSVTRNDMVVINPHVAHTEKSQSDSPLEYIVLGIDGLSFSFEDMACVQDGLCVETEFGMVYKYNVQSANVYAYLNIMLEEITHRESNYEAVCQNLLEVLLICMLRNDNLSVFQNRNTFINRECMQIKNYLDSNYSENITLDALAAMMHMNKYYMAHAFSRFTGLSPIHYLQQKRIQEARALLESTNYSIAEISSMLGFSSQSYFSQSIKKITGESPIQHRNEYRTKKCLYPKQMK